MRFVILSRQVYKQRKIEYIMLRCSEIGGEKGMEIIVIGAMAGAAAVTAGIMGIMPRFAGL